MDTVVSSAGGNRGSQDETSPIPLEFEIISRRKRVVHREGRSQDETAPFPLEFEVVARNTRHSQDETSPFLLEFSVILPSGDEAFVRTARPPRTRSAQRPSPRGLPRLKWHGVDASRELRQYAARIAAGESLPPYRGPIVANAELAGGLTARDAVNRAAVNRDAVRSLRAAAKAPADDSKGLVKLALALMVMSALVVASAVLGNDAELRNVGEAVSDWFSELAR